MKDKSGNVIDNSFNMNDWADASLSEEEFGG